MATFSKDYFYTLAPCCPWPEWIFEVPESGPFTGAEIKTILTDGGRLEWLSWVVGGSVALATEFLDVVGEDVDLEGWHERTPLHWAVMRQDVATVTYLVAAGASKILPDADGYTQNEMALLTENADIISAMGLS